MVDAMNTMIRTPFHIILLGLLAGEAIARAHFSHV